jgi:hypothetical protein
MALDVQERDRAEQALRFVLLLVLWVLWLLLRATWAILTELVSVRSRKMLQRCLAWGTLAGLIFLSPHAVGLWWSRLMLVDAAELAALQAEGRDPSEIETDLRRRAFQLGFLDILAQPEAVRVRREEREAGAVCIVSIDFQHQPTVYGWTVPPLRITARVERYVLPKSDPMQPRVRVD